MAWTLYHHRPLSSDAGDVLERVLSASSRAVVLAVRAERYDQQPFLIDDHGRAAGLVNTYFGSRSFRGYAPSTRKKYALSIRLWLNFCDSRRVFWDAAGPDDVADFKFWRMTDERNPSRVAGSALHGDIAAVSSLYRWAERRHGIVDPIIRREVRQRVDDPSRSSGSAAAVEPAGVRDRNVKWLEPLAVRRWIDIGLRALDRDGRERADSRNRTGTRDAAFASLLYGSGLRVTEGASLLTVELPEDTNPGRVYWSCRLAASCAKGRRPRPWWVPRAALREVWTYAEGQRAESVRRAQHHGRYAALDGIRIVESRHGDRRLVLRGPSGAHTVSLDALTPDERRKLFFETSNGLEPVALWLNEDGLPRPAHAWQATFRTGNERTRRAGLPWFACTPHMLRHSFALRWYSVGRLLWDRRLSHLTDREQRDFREQFGDTWQFVQTLLGHRHPQTTVDIYLEPFKSLEVELLLECAAEVPLPALMKSMVERDSRVLGDPIGSS